MPAPSNDLCANAIVIASLPYTSASIDNTLATESAGDPTFSVAGDGSIAGGATTYKTVWWKYTSATDQRVQLTCAEPNIMIGVFTGGCGGFTEYASWALSLTIELTALTTYYVCLGSFTNTGYTFTLSVATTTDPSNQLQLTAKAITSLPFTESVDFAAATDGGDQGPVYYRYTAAAGDVVLGVFAYGGGSFDVVTLPYTGTANDYDSNTNWLSIGSQTNRAMQFPLATLTTYIIKVQKSSGTGTTTPINFQLAPTRLSSVPAGLIIVPDDTDGFPAVALDRTNGTVRGFIYPFPGGEQGDVLDNGVALVEDNTAQVVKLYDKSLGTLLATVDPFGASTVSLHTIRMSPGLQIFYVGGNIAAAAKITTVDGSGVQGGTTWTLPSAGLVALAPNNDGSIIYVAGQVSSINTPVKRWITGSSSMGTDLLAAQGANTECVDLLVLDDGTIIVLHFNTSTKAIDVRKMTDGGSVLGTFSTTQADTTTPKLAYDYDNRSRTFWLWTHSSGQSTFRKITVATMSAALSFQTREYENGAYQGTATATPDHRFGNSFSCPFFLTRTSPTADDSEPCCPCDCQPTTTKPPSTSPIVSHTGPILPPVEPLAWTPACSGGGTVPSASDPTDAESWVS